ncbi:hypothetical protein [Helicobacter pametensis]|uniref:hypothetical protein n=1 Tax=Helicobacter pametensis TaxID=95149 RepID=UPI000483665E|nr:hypothetical protein [Helicobacter pametensis]
MRKILFLLALIIGSLIASGHSKIVYLRLLTPLDKGEEFYVGQKIQLKYSLLLFSGASLMDVEFIPNSNKVLADGVEILNPNSSWIKKEDDSYENTFIYKIKAPNFAIPTLKVMAISQDGSYADSDENKGKKFEAIALDGEKYTGVLSEDLRVSNVRAKKYDEWNNIMVFDLESKRGNLEDFKLKEITKQGFHEEVIEQDDGRMRAMYYCVLPAHLKELKFTFFNLTTLRYEEKIIPIVLQSDRVSTQSDLEPKNNFLIFSNIVLALLVVALLVLAFFLRSYRRIFWILILTSVVLLVFWIYGILGVREVVLKPNAKITILPTQNSTLMQSVSFPLRVEVIGGHGGFYKIKLEDSRIGWVRKDECQ